MVRSVVPALSVVALSAACTDLPPIPPGECGNGVVELGEQCDTFALEGVGTACGDPDDEELACHYVCSEGAVCPAGWGCGPDERCRFASGFVEEAPTIAAGFSELMIGDADGDGAADVIGHLTSGTAVQAWYGDGQGGFGSRFHLNTGFASAAATFGDLDDDGRTDVVVPLDDGLFVLLGRSDRTLAPVAYSSIELPAALAGNPPVPLDDVYTFTVGFQPLYSAPGLMLELGAPLNTLAMCFLNGCGDFALGNFALLGDRRVADLAGRLARANVDRLGRPEEEFALAFVGEITVSIYTPQAFDAPPADGFFEARPELRAIIALPAPIVRPASFGDPAESLSRLHESASTHFGDVDGDGNLDLLVAVSGGVFGIQTAVALGNGDGTFAGAVIDPRFDQLVSPDGSSCELGGLSFGTRMPWPLAVGDFDASGLDRRADYVTENGVFMTRGPLGAPRLCPAFPSFVQWSEATTGDFNGDGHLDVAALGGAIIGTKNVDFRTGDGLGHFNRVLLDTDHFGTKLRSGDFDGDFVTDLALVELDWIDDASVQSESLSVMFGSAFAVPSPPVSMGRLSYIDILEPGYNPINPFNFDVTVDLMAQSNEAPDGSGVRSIAVMVGTAERRMLSSFALESEQGPNQSYLISSLHAGPFFAEGGDDPFDDLVAVTTLGGADVQIASAPSVWLIHGRERAEYRVSDAKIMAPDCPGVEAFAYGCAAYAAGDVDGDGLSELVALEDAACRGAGSATLLLANAEGTAESPDLVCSSQALPAMGVPRGMQVVDLNGDGYGEILTGFQRFDASGDDAFHVYWNDAGTIDPTPLVVPVGSGTFVLGGTAANLDADPELELVLLLSVGIGVAQIDVTARTIAAPTPLVPGFFASGVAVAGDVTGDGLDDLVFTDLGQTRVFLSIPGGEREVPIASP